MPVEQAGYSKVYNVKDGITTWLKTGNPVVKQGAVCGRGRDDTLSVNPAAQNCVR